MPKLKYILKEVKREKAMIGIGSRLPITPSILRKLKKVWGGHSGEMGYQNIVGNMLPVLLCFL